MKRVLLLIIICFVQFLNAQTQELKRANRFFDKTFYSEAIPLYENVMVNNQSMTVLKNLADSYYYTNDYSKAQRLYGSLIARFNKDLDKEYYFKYAQTLKAVGKYDEANTIMRDYYVSSNDNLALSIFDNQVIELENVSAIGQRFTLKNLSINTSNSEFGAVIFKNDLVFAGMKKSSSLFDKKYKWNGERYLDLMSVPLENINVGDSLIKSFSTDINTAMHEANAVFTKDGKTVYFTRNNFSKGRRAKNQDKISNLQIFRGELKDGKWINIVSLPFNNENYSVEHPALSADEKTLYFASDMPGSLGSFDLYSVSINGTSYGSPKNLGTNINTSKKEQFPFIAKDHKLYFSSNGHTGYGLMDVFVADEQDGDFSKPSNVGLPLNSVFDDFSFYIDSDTKKGYFSSNRPSGKGSDDIYEFTEIKPLLIQECKQFIEGVVRDVDTKLPLENTLVTVLNSEGKELQRFQTAQDGVFSFAVACDSKFSVVAVKEEFTKDGKVLYVNKDRDKRNDASMALKSLATIQKEEDLASQLKKDAEMVLQEKSRIAAMALVEKAKQDKVVAAAKEKEAAKIKEIERVKSVLDQEKDIVKVKDQLVIKTDPIYFDYNLWYIRKDSKPILDKVIDLMKKYPNMIVEIGSHTDNRGNDKYNLNLSNNRANATRDYFISNGIPKNRISAKGYGETVQVIKCEPSASCTEEQHELNRRTVFVIKNL